MMKKDVSMKAKPNSSPTHVSPARQAVRHYGAKWRRKDNNHLPRHRKGAEDVRKGHHQRPGGGRINEVPEACWLRASGRRHDSLTHCEG